jgi:hypothetical protein
MRSWGLFLLALLFTAGCATRFERVLAEVRTADDALSRFGRPSAEEILSGERVRREWTVHEDELVPGQYVSRDIYAGHDREGYLVFLTQWIFVPEHIRQKRCRLTLVSDPAGVLLEQHWQGNACERLLVPAHGADE